MCTRTSCSCSILTVNRVESHSQTCGCLGTTFWFVWCKLLDLPPLPPHQIPSCLSSLFDKFNSGIDAPGMPEALVPYTVFCMQLPVSELWEVLHYWCIKTWHGSLNEGKVRSLQQTKEQWYCRWDKSHYPKWINCWVLKMDLLKLNSQYFAVWYSAVVEWTLRNCYDLLGPSGSELSFGVSHPLPHRTGNCWSYSSGV